MKCGQNVGIHIARIVVCGRLIMKCPLCGEFYDDKASDREGPECAEEAMADKIGNGRCVMASDEIGKGDTISREQAIGAMDQCGHETEDCRGECMTTRHIFADQARQALRALPSIAPLGRRSDA